VPLLKKNPPNNALRHSYALYWLATNPPLEAFLQEPLLELSSNAERNQSAGTYLAPVLSCAPMGKLSLNNLSGLTCVT
jgi:hypothetical protein